MVLGLFGSLEQSQRNGTAPGFRYSPKVPGLSHAFGSLKMRIKTPGVKTLGLCRQSQLPGTRLLGHHKVLGLSQAFGFLRLRNPCPQRLWTVLSFWVSEIEIWNTRLLDRFSFDVYWIQTNKHPDRQAKYI